MTTIDASGNLHNTIDGQFAGHLRTEADPDQVIGAATTALPYEVLVAYGRAARADYPADEEVDLDAGIPLDIYQLFEQVTGRPYNNRDEQDELDILVIAGAFEGSLAEDETDPEPAWHEQARAAGMDPADFTGKEVLAAKLRSGQIIIVDGQLVTVTRTKITHEGVTVTYFEYGNFLPVRFGLDEQVTMIEPIHQPSKPGVCESCGRTHDASQVGAVDRFNPNGPAGYRARFAGSPVRATREAAEQDMCRRWAAKN